MYLYADGGVIGHNPSKIGGTWAFVIVDEKGKVLHKDAGVYVPEEMGTSTVTNNQTELVAILLGMQWANARRIKIKTVFSDSQITLGRMFQGWSLKNIPDWMIDLKDSLSVRGVRGQFIKGHNGDKFNEMCDRMCEQQANEYDRVRTLYAAYS
jgi:ribonuclease HI